MGFIIPELSEVTLEFDEGHALDGLEVTCRSTTGADLDRLLTTGNLYETHREFVRDYVIRWNAEDAEGEIPADESAIGRIEPWAFSAMLVGYSRALYRVSGPLGMRPSVGQSLAAS